MGQFLLKTHVLKEQSRPWSGQTYTGHVPRSWPMRVSGGLTLTNERWVAACLWPQRSVEMRGSVLSAPARVNTHAVIREYHKWLEIINLRMKMMTEEWFLIIRRSDNQWVSRTLMKSTTKCHHSHQASPPKLSW